MSGADVPGEIANAAGLTDGRPFCIETLKLDEGADATEWKLVQVEGARRAAASHIHDGAGLQYVTMHVQALAPLLARLIEHGIQPPADHPLGLGNGQYFALVRDPDGVFIELIGPLHAYE